MVKKNKEQKDPKEKNNKNSKIYIIGAISIIFIIAFLFILTTGKNKETTNNEEIKNTEQEEEPLIQIPSLTYDLSEYTNNLNEQVGKEATLQGYLEWTEEANNNNAIIQKYYLVDSHNNQITLAFAGLNSDFSKYEPFFIKGETTTEAYKITGKFTKTFDNIRFEVASITEK